MCKVEICIMRNGLRVHLEALTSIGELFEPTAGILLFHLGVYFDGERLTGPDYLYKVAIHEEFF